MTDMNARTGCHFLAMMQRALESVACNSWKRTESAWVSRSSLGRGRYLTMGAVFRLGRGVGKEGERAAAVVALALPILMPAVTMIVDNTAMAQEDDLLRLAPALAVSRLTSLDAPIDIVRTGWGPFHRLCTAFSFQDGDGVLQPGGTTCLQIVATRDASGGGWRVRVEPEAVGTAASPLFTMLRHDDGTITEVSAHQPGGTVPLTPAAQVQFTTTARAGLAALGLVRQLLSPGVRFALPEPREWAQQAAARPMNCLAETRGVFASRDVVVARCTIRFEQPSTPQAVSRIALAGRFAIDVETGVVIAQSYARRTDTLYAAPGQPLRSTGVHILLGRTWSE
jgi:hypothetical protein